MVDTRSAHPHLACSTFQKSTGVASKIPILFTRLGHKRHDSRLAIMSFEDAESPRPIPVFADLRGRMDEPTATVRHGPPSRRESSPERTARLPTASAQ